MSNRFVAYRWRRYDSHVVQRPTESSHAGPATPSWRWLMAGFLAVSAVFFGEIYEQLVFLPNWLIGDVPSNVRHFRGFQHAVDPGVFFFPAGLVALVAHTVLLRRRAGYADRVGRALWSSLAAVLATLALTAYVIPFLNVPLFGGDSVPDDQLRPALIQWGVLNGFRIALPGYALMRLAGVLRVAR